MTINREGKTDISFREIRIPQHTLEKVLDTLTKEGKEIISVNALRKNDENGNRFVIQYRQITTNTKIAL
jgi:hypothetical protein